jgi:ubiquinone biosynthesis protein COQ9
MTEDLKSRLLDAALSHVSFDGWSPRAFDAAVADAGIDPAEAKAACPRGAIDLAVAFHRRGDDDLRQWLQTEDLSSLKFREKIAAAVRHRIASGDREIVRRGSALFALPQHVPEGARLIWETADTIWNGLGDTSDDFNWYTKRLTLSGVYSSTVLFWLGDASEGAARSWNFLDRRIADVMRFETFKARARENRLVAALMDHPLNPLTRIHAPRRGPVPGYPGSRSGA